MTAHTTRMETCTKQNIELESIRFRKRKTKQDGKIITVLVNKTKTKRFFKDHCDLDVRRYGNGKGEQGGARGSELNVSSSTSCLTHT